MMIVIDPGLRALVSRSLDARWLLRTATLSSCSPCVHGNLVPQSLQGAFESGDKAVVIDDLKKLGRDG